MSKIQKIRSRTIQIQMSYNTKRNVTEYNYKCPPPCPHGPSLPRPQGSRPQDLEKCLSRHDISYIHIHILWYDVENFWSKSKYKFDKLQMMFNGETEIWDADVAFAVQQDVLWLAIPEHFIIVHVLQNNLITCNPNISYDHGTIEVING